MCLLMQTAVCKDLWVSPHMDFSRVCYPAIKKAPQVYSDTGQCPHSYFRVTRC